MIYVTGDTHGIYGAVKRLSVNNFPEQKEMTRNDYVIVCGDFGGIWDYDSRYNKEGGILGDHIHRENGESPKERYWLNWFSKKSFTLLFCDGNHENFDRLEAYPEVDFHGGRAHRIRENVFHLMRGYVFDIDGKSIFVFGGAKSHDIRDGIIYPSSFDSRKILKKKIKRMKEEKKFFRVDRVSWWDREVPDEDEMLRGITNLEKHKNEVDFIITHCAPAGIAALMKWYDVDPCTRFLNTVSETVRFNRWYFGHYHRNEQVLGKFICIYEQVVRIN